MDSTTANYKACEILKTVKEFILCLTQHDIRLRISIEPYKSVLLSICLCFSRSFKIVLFVWENNFIPWHLVKCSNALSVV